MGYALCCASTPIPGTLTMTVTFQAGTNSATYCDEYQNTTLTYFTTPPAYAIFPFNLSNRFYSPVLVDCIGTSFYYVLNCNSPGVFVLNQQSIAPAASGTAATWTSWACSPFLLATMTTRAGGYLGGFGAIGRTDNIVIS